MVDAGEAERARRAALTPQQAAAETEIRRDLAGPVRSAAQIDRAPVAETTDDYQAHLGAQRETTQDHDLGRDV